MRYLVLLFMLVLGAAFIFFNWTAVNAPVSVDLFFAKAEVPLGLMLLVWFAIMFIIVLYGMLAQQMKALATVSKISKELDAQRKLASNAEDSRVTQVASDFDKKWQSWVEAQKGILSQTEDRLSAGQNKIIEAFKEAQDQMANNNNELAASISGALDNMDDKISKVLISNNTSNNSSAE